MKYIGFHLVQTDKFKNDPFRKENLIYNPEGDYYVCPVGQKLLKKGIRHLKSRNGFRSEVTQYEAGNCSYCILKSLCTKAKGEKDASSLEKGTALLEERMCSIGECVNLFIL